MSLAVRPSVRLYLAQVCHNVFWGQTERLTHLDKFNDIQTTFTYLVFRDKGLRPAKNHRERGLCNSILVALRCQYLLEPKLAR